MNGPNNIGGKLRTARENMDLDLKDVAHVTRIPLASLKAMEINDYNIFPSPAYARSFLAQYGDFLKLDTHDWLKHFETGNVLANRHEYLKNHDEHIGPDNSTPKSNTPQKTTSQYKKEHPRSNSSPILQAATVFFITTLLIGGGFYAYHKYEPTFSAQTDGDASSRLTDKADLILTSENESPMLVDIETDIVVAATKTVAQTVSHEISIPPSIPKARSGPPPKALVIDEDE